MNLDDAIYHASHNYPGGIPALAVRMGANAGTLQNKVNPNFATAHVTLRDLEAIVTFTQSPLPAAALAALCGCEVLPVALPSGADDMEVLESVTRLAKEFGDVCRSVQQAVADGHVTRREINQVERQAQELRGAIRAVECLIRSRHDRERERGEAATPLFRAAI